MSGDRAPSSPITGGGRLQPQRLLHGACALVVVLCLAAFWPVTRNGFVDWDDPINFTRNPHFQGLEWSHLHWAWTAFHLGVYQPLAWMLLELQHALWGLWAQGYHRVSLVLHAVNSVLLLLVTIDLIRRSDPWRFRRHRRAVVVTAALSTALFAVHPMRVEVVAWASCQPYLPCAMFSLLCVWSYLRSMGRPGRVQAVPQPGWYWASVGFFAAALLCKAMALGLPLVLILLDVFPLRRMCSRPAGRSRRSSLAVLLEKWPYVVLLLVFGALAVLAKHDPTFTRGFEGPRQQLTLPQLVQGFQAVTRYLQLTAWPHHISAYYPASQVVDLRSAEVIAAILLVPGLTWGAWRLRHRCPGAGIAWLTFLVLLSPTLGGVRFSAQIAADRYAYIPIMALHVLVAWSMLVAVGRWQRAAGRLKHAAAAAAGGALAAATAALLIHSTAVSASWASPVALWSWADAHGGAMVGEVQNYLGLAHLHEGRVDEAKRRLADAIRFKPRFPDPYVNLAAIWANAGDFERSEPMFRKALEIQPRHMEARLNLGAILQRHGRMNEAVLQVSMALRDWPDEPQAVEGLTQAIDVRGVDPGVADAARQLLRNPRDAAAMEAVSRAVARAPTP